MELAGSVGGIIEYILKQSVSESVRERINCLRRIQEKREMPFDPSRPERFSANGDDV